MTRYLLPCSCSHRIAVGPGQAGGTITCPGCGAAVAVPRLGALTRLDAIAADATVASSRDWNGARAWVLAGVAAAVVGTVTAGWLHGLRVGVAPFDESLIRATVEAAAVDQVHAAWLTFEQQGVSRPALPEETRRQRRAAALEGLEIIAWGAAAAGVVVAIVAAIPACRPRRGGGRA